MNFVKESIAFNSMIEDNELHPNERALWNALFHIWNRSYWAKWFPVKNSELTFHDKSTSVPTVHNARNILKQKGFIDFKTMGKNKMTWYNMTILFDEEDDDYGYGYDNKPINGTLKESLRQSLKQPLRQSLRQPLKQGNTIYKHKTINNKQIIKLNQNNAPAREHKAPIPIDKPDWLER